MKANRIKAMKGRILVTISMMLLLLLGVTTPSWAADDKSVTQQAEEAISDTTQAATQSLATLQNRISDSRLVNRSRDQNVAFILMGILVGSFTGMFSKIGSSALGIAARLGLGLGGAFIGGMIVRIAQIDFGWGVVSMTYEELLFSFLGAFALVAVSRLIRYQMKKKKESKS